MDRLVQQSPQPDHESGEVRTRRALLHMLEDLQREHRLVQEARHHWVDTVDSIGDPIMVHDAEGRIVRANKAYSELAGVGFPQIVGRKYWECFPRRGGPMSGCLEAAACAAKGGHGEEFAVAGSEIFTSKAFLLGDNRHSGTQVLHLFQNVTEERRQQEAVRTKAQRAIAQAEALSAIASSGALFAGDLDKFAREITERVSAACRVARVNVWLFNEDETELSCVDHFDAATRSHASGIVLRQAQFANEFRALKAAPYVAADDPLTDPRTAGYVETYLKPNRITSMLDAVVETSGRYVGLLCLEHVGQAHHWEADEIAFAQQVAEKIAVATSNRRARQAEASMRVSEQRFRALFEDAPVGIAELAATGHYVSVNRRLCEITGYTADELRARNFRDLTHPEDLGRDEQNLKKLVAGTIPVYSVEKRYLRKDGAIIWAAVTVTSVKGASRDGSHFVSIVEDITPRKAAEAELRASRDLLESVVENAPMRVFWKDAELRFLGCNSAFARDAGLSRPEELLGKDDFQMAWREQAELYRADDRAVIDSDTPKLNIEGPQPTPDGRTIWLRTSKVPLHGADGRTIGILGIYDDVTKHKLAEENLRGALAGTVEAMAATVEARDPYTAGHQRRVADLAAAIASEMGMPAGTVAGIRFGAMIHDLGKIQVPAELLSKPTRLTKLEFELIKTHAQSGYDIVKRIKFPWRVAEIVHQHHERLDGSGYPQGLKGEAIAIEARIVAVADVVEAMASHRPYRPGLGIEASLKEIQDRKGTWFEPAAVDACLRLFREKRFEFEKS